MNHNEISIHSNKRYFKYILEIIAIIYIISLMITISTVGLKNIFFKNEYSYKNVKLYTVNPIDETDINTTLIDVYNRANKSILYNSNIDYIVCLANSKKTEFLYFKFRDVLMNFKSAINNIKDIGKENISSIILNKSLGGYVLPADILGTSFLRELDVEIMTHELAHQMVFRASAGPLIRLYSSLINTSIHEGYANLIAYDGMDYEYGGSDFIGGSNSYRVEDVLHDDGKYYRHRYFTVNWKDTYYIDDYSTENMLIVRNLLVKNDILTLVKKINSRKRLEEETCNFFLNYFETFRYHKIKGDANVLEGTWMQFGCDYEKNPCKLGE